VNSYNWLLCVADDSFESSPEDCGESTTVTDPHGTTDVEGGEVGESVGEGVDPALAVEAGEVTVGTKVGEGKKETTGVEASVVDVVAVDGEGDDVGIDSDRGAVGVFCAEKSWEETTTAKKTRTAAVRKIAAILNLPKGYSIACLIQQRGFLAVNTCL
jgi:hypothetical protein